MRDILSTAINTVILFHPFIPRHPLEEFFIVRNDDQLELALLAGNRAGQTLTKQQVVLLK